MCNMFQMHATIVLATGNKDDIPMTVHVGPDHDIKEIGLSNTTLIGMDKVPPMLLLLQGAHYDLAVERGSITGKFSCLDEGYNAEEEEEKSADKPPKSVEEKLSDLEEKYGLLEKENKEFKEEIKQLKSKLKNKNYNSNSLDEEADNTEAECLPKLKSKGF